MKHLALGLSMRGLGYHPTAWLDPEVPVDGAMDFQFTIDVAKMAERGLFDFVFFADHAAVVVKDTPKGYFGRAQEGKAEFEPFTLIAALSQHTSNIGLIVTASSTLHEPYQLARQFLSIDHLSGGRAGWNVVTSSRDAEAQNYNMDKMPEKNLRYERAKEAVEVAFGLWESWEEDAFPRDRATHMFFDPKKMHPLNYAGNHFKVKGPLTLPRSPQGRPIIAQAGASLDGMDFAATVADVIYAVQTKFEGAQQFYQGTKQRVTKFGRDPDHVKIMPGLLPVVGRTSEEAQAKYKRLLSYLDPVVGIERLERFFGDLSGYDVDGPLPELDPNRRMVSRADLNLRLAREQNWSIRRLYEETVISHGHHVAIGTPQDIADDIEKWFKEGAADGFNVVPPVLPGSARDFVDFVVPELQRRGLFRTAYESTTLRGNLGLPDLKPRYPS
jgi:N-acetyl-S-(2-succino)cysteine monooxygenase